MSPDCNIGHVIEYRTPETTVVERESAWFDEIDLDTETGCETQQCTGILRYVRLEQGQPQTTSKSGFIA
jgi:hypothetical protein